jgi:hypothetical protein
MAGATGIEGLPHYTLDHLPGEFEAPGGSAWADFIRKEPMPKGFESGGNRYLVEARWSKAHHAVGGRAAQAIHIKGSFRVGPGCNTFEHGWLVVWEECLLFVLGDREFKETYEVAVSQMAAELRKVPQMGGKQPSQTHDPFTTFFYVLLRQMATPGEVEQQVHAMEQGPARGDQGWQLTNAYLAGYAENLVRRLRDLGTDPIAPKASSIIEGLLRVIDGRLSPSDEQTDIEAAQQWLDLAGRGRVEVRRR